MRTTKILVSLLLTVLILGSFCAVSAGAAPSDNFDNCNFLQNVQTVEDVLKVFCASDNNMPSASAFSAMMDGEDVEVLSLDSASDEPVTYLCLVDISGSITKPALQEAKVMLRSLCNSIDAKDQMMIATLAEKLEMSSYMSSKTQIMSAIDSITKTEKDTNLYRGIVDTLDELITNTNVTTRKCLVVFSDGIDDIRADQNASIWTAAKDKVLSTRIPVYTMLPSVEDYYREYQKSLSSLAVDYSVGGEAYYLSDSKVTADEVGRKIAADMKGDKVLRLDLTTFRPREEEFTLAVEYTDLIGIRRGDTLKVISSVLGPIKPIVTSKPKESMNIYTGGDIIEVGPDRQTWIKYGLGALCLLLAILVICLILKKKKDKEKRAAQEKDARIHAEQQELLRRKTSGDGYVDRTVAVGAADNFGSHSSYARTSTPSGGGKPVRFTLIGNNSLNFDMSLQEGRETTVGRSSKSDIILNKDDSKLSGKHFALLMKNNRLMIRDAGSTNGTAVNGVALKGNNGIELHSGDTVSAGSYQYRVRF